MTAATIDTRYWASPLVSARRIEHLATWQAALGDTFMLRLFSGRQQPGQVNSRLP